MKALTICQPYAELIARGDKWIENRTWYTPHRGPLLIHAGKSRKYMRDGDDERFPDMAFGAVIAIASLVDCEHEANIEATVALGEPHHLSRDRCEEILGHVHCEGPYLWILSDIKRVVPVHVNGKQGLWEMENRGAIL